METIEMETTKPTLQTLLGLGVPGSGKTAFALTLPKPVLVHSFDEGYGTLANSKGITVLSFSEKDGSSNNVAEEFQRVLDGYIMKGVPKNKNGEEYKSIVIDPISFLGDYIKSKSSSHLDGYAIYSDVGDRLNRVLKCLMVLKKKGFVVYVTSHIKLKDDATKGTETFLPAIESGIREKLAGWFDAKFFFEVQTIGGKPKYTINMIPDIKHTSGVRVPPGVSSTLTTKEEPDYQKLITKLQGENKPC